VTLFEPLVNVLTVLTVLSFAAERLANLVKLRFNGLWKNGTERQREYNISLATLVVGVTLAIVTKADLFSMLAHASEPWSTLGWAHWDGTDWVHCSAVVNAAGILQAVLGCAVTGVSLGFGSRFWHDVLGAVLELRNVVKRRAIG
jgi:hypothetical protein